MNAQHRFQSQSQKSPEELEREIDAQRDHIGELVGALENKLSPGEMFERVLGYTRGHGRDFAQNLGNTVKANPVPTILTAAGLLWLYAGSDRAPPVPYRGAASGVNTGPSVGERAGQAGHDLSERARHLREDASGRAHDLGDRAHRLGENASARWNDARDRAGNTMHDTGRAIRDGSRRTADSVQSAFRSNPLALGAVGIAAGALLGALLPSTEQEDRLLGEYSDRAGDRARRSAQEGLGRAAEAGSRAVERAQERVAHRGDGGSGSSAPPQTRSQTNPDRPGSMV
ncbi:DUF3618 domain-containing protein [Coralloluteibacterium stylophorae]|uniref:DUF3618 domain-containing protein n=1 Tax=Coralloluteibacterium stylophorae TaxID=1776034 RepID=A0A8J8AZ59_9GAMM|nr:DUF3618 domain-containing protein [Coralloluteibacterium stylophorae]MBS7458860.1 DUF3618 domain-containing protein [Coralloluteibacterium stylophorae]